MITNSDLEQWVKEYVAGYRASKGMESDWRQPVVGVAAADDLLFPVLKEAVGPNHRLPVDFIPDAQSVIAFFLPFSEDIIRSNVGGKESSREWDIANIETNQLIADINGFLQQKIGDLGYEATNLPATYDYDEHSLTSNWSHRHIAYIAGIGTFGINNMIITEKGCCGRIGSIVTNLPLRPTYRSDQENCLYKANGSCGKCASYCVAGAMSLEGSPYVDRRKCHDQIYDDKVPQYDIGIGDACGKCMCAMPCSTKNPAKRLFSPKHMQ